MAEPQSFKNHAKLDPPFHFFLGPVSFLLVILAIIDLVRNPGWMSALYLLIAVFLVVLVFKIRLYSLKVQDRVIRLEERLRLQSLLPLTVQARIPELSVDQLVGLRFASDAELPGLVEKTLAENWNRKQIKEAIQNWRPDNWRI